MRFVVICFWLAAGSTRGCFLWLRDRNMTFQFGLTKTMCVVMTRAVVRTEQQQQQKTNPRRLRHPPTAGDGIFTPTKSLLIHYATAQLFATCLFRDNLCGLGLFCKEDFPAIYWEIKKEGREEREWAAWAAAGQDGITAWAAARLGTDLRCLVLRWGRARACLGWASKRVCEWAPVSSGCSCSKEAMGQCCPRSDATARRCMPLAGRPTAPPLVSRRRHRQEPNSGPNPFLQVSLVPHCPLDRFWA